MAANKDQEWVQKNILKEKDLILYGTLTEDFATTAPEDFWKLFRLSAEEYLNSGPHRSTFFQQKIDQLLNELIKRDQRYGYPPPYCHKGCAQCCHEVVYCTDEEASAISNFCHQSQIPLDLEKLKRQLTFVEFDSKKNHTGNTTWSKQSSEDQSCIFLDKQEKSCRIWPVRPLVCRVHLAEETDRYCRPHNGVGNPLAKGINYPEWSYILSAIFTMHSDSIKKTMGQLLLKLY